MKPIYGWWFSKGYQLGYDDKRPVRVGITHTVEPPLELCKWGLHLSIDPLDALRNAKGLIAWRVKGSGEIIKGKDKVACSERTYLSGGYNVHDALAKYIRLCALDICRLVDTPFEVIRYLRTGNPLFREDALQAATEDAQNYSIYDASSASLAKIAAENWGTAWMACHVAECAALLIPRHRSVGDTKFPPWKIFNEVRAAQRRRLGRLLREYFRSRLLCESA